MIGRKRTRSVGWTYANPSAGYEALRDQIAFYPGRVDGAWLDDELVEAQASDFYGGWITADLVGPFKGSAGTLNWLRAGRVSAPWLPGSRHTPSAA